MTKKQRGHILSILMGVENMSNNAKYPELIVFAGPNGSGKTTITKLAKVIEPYIINRNEERISELTSIKR